MPTVNAIRAELTHAEHQILEAIRHRWTVARNLNKEHAESLTLGQRTADMVARGAGSWPFIIGFITFLAGWVWLNIRLLRIHPFDPYPFILLNLVLSAIAAIQAPVIMMSQNRVAERDRLRAENDYQVNVKAELEIQRLHEKVDGLREAQWAGLLAMQEEQLTLLRQQVAALTRLIPPSDGTIPTSA